MIPESLSYKKICDCNPVIVGVLKFHKKSCICHRRFGASKREIQAFNIGKGVDKQW